MYNTTYSSNSSSGYGYVYRIGCVATPLIEVSLLEPGSLGTEVLYQTDHVKNVKKLKVSGRMNDDDWAKIQMMKSLFELDLKDAVTDAVPARQFDGTRSASASQFLNKVVLPDVLKSIGDGAFRCTFVEDVTFPTNMTTIGQYAFYRTMMKNIILPDSLSSLGSWAFAVNYNAEEINLGKKIETIPERAFSGLLYATNFTLPNTIKTIGTAGFAYCSEMELNSLPSTLVNIGENAFGYVSFTNITIPETVTTIGKYAI